MGPKQVMMTRTMPVIAKPCSDTDSSNLSLNYLDDCTDDFDGNKKLTKEDYLQLDLSIIKKPVQRYRTESC